ncbi:hypothetical protein A5881_001895 [Enterococcus termitis]|nr:hypothetical protein A5881_001783 [Enterococcus termitis]
MKKIALGLLVLSLSLVFSGCGSSKEKSANSSSTEQTTDKSTEDTSTKETETMKKVEAGLEEKGVEVEYYQEDVMFTREKSIDYDYFKLVFQFDSTTNELFLITLKLKGNIDGEKKDPLYYGVSSGRIVEKEYRNTDINALAEILESIGYSDKELVEFAWWYYNNNK